MEGLERFTAAQNPIWPRVVAELTEGAKRSHWMWFVFPQIEGLGQSPMSYRYAIASLDEARAYLAHPVLGPRLREGVTLILAHEGRTPTSILGGIDAVKFRSSLTLFAMADPDEPLFQRALDAFYGGVHDPQTLALLGG
jgi:uncharacterized protein (DUF1810 family)